MAPLAARMNDPVTGTDIHIVLIPTPGGPVPTPLPHPYVGTINAQTSTDVMINSQPAALQDSTSMLTSPHIPSGGPFQRPPTGMGTIMVGSPTVRVNGRALARQGDPVRTCNDPVDQPTSTITGGSPNVVVA